MRNRVQTNLPAHRGRGVSTDFRRQGVGCFVARGGKKENDVRDEPQHQRFGSEIIHKQFSVESPRPESKFMGQLRKPAPGKSAFLSPWVLCMFFPIRVLAAFLGVRRKCGLRADDESLFPPRTCKS